MAEDFLEGIYKYAKIIVQLKQCESFLKVHNFSEFSKLWRYTANGLTDLLEKYRQIDEDSAGALFDSINKLLGNIESIYITGDVISHEIIPHIYKFNKQFCCIDVEENDWRICSSRSGFLTIYNREIDSYLHSVDNPLWDEMVRASYYYKGKYEKAYILGMGLGYFPYSLWEEAKGSVEIYVYERDQQLVDYAKHYGVLSWIPNEHIHITVNDNADELVLDFLSDRIKDKKEEFIYVSDWFLKELSDATIDLVSSIKQEVEAQRDFEKDYSINYYRNKSKFNGYLSEVSKTDKKEFVIIAAGPSVDDRIDYIKSVEGKKTIVAVNTIFRRLIEEGVIADYLCVLDPTESIYAHISGIEDKTQKVPLIAESVSNWKFVEAYKGPKYRVLGAAYEPVIQEADEHPEDTLYLGGTVTSLALEIAIKMQAEQIDMIGVDLGTPGNKQYAGDKSVSEDKRLNRHLEVTAADGGKVQSTDTFVLFKKYLEKQIERNPQILFRNLSEHGAHIEGTICGPWSKLISINEIKEAALCSKSGTELLIKIAIVLSDIYVGDEFANVKEQTYDAKDVNGHMIELMRKWKEYAEEIKNSRGVIYLNSAIAELTAKTDDVVSFIRNTQDARLNKEELYYVYAQVKERINNKRLNCDERVLQELSALKKRIQDLYKNEIGEIDKREGRFNDNLYWFIVSEITKDNTGVEQIKMKCKEHILKNEKVLLINASDKSPFVGKIRLFSAEKENNEEEYISTEYIEYDGVSIPYFQCESIMPDIGIIRILVENALRLNPKQIISSEDGPLTWIIAEYRDVVNV